MKKIVITGAAGEVGLNILDVLNEDKIKQYKIIAVDKNIHNLKIAKKIYPRAETVEADLASEGEWTKHFKGAYVVIQLQAQISSPDAGPYFDNNIKSVQNVINACDKYHIKRLIHASSSVVISVAKDGYANTKRSGEKIVESSKVPHIILRPTLMYGCYDIKHLGYMVKTFEKCPIFPMPGSGRYIRQPVYVKDFCRIIINCIERKMDNRSYNITGKQKIYLIDCLKTIFNEKNKRRWFIKIPLPMFHMLIRIYGIMNRKSVIIPDQLTAMTAGDIFPVIAWDKIFNVKPTSFDDGVRDMLHSKNYDLTFKMERLAR